MFLFFFFCFRFFFFFKQKTAYEIVSRDWSSDVCSSDLSSITFIITSSFLYSPECPGLLNLPSPLSLRGFPCKLSSKLFCWLVNTSRRIT